MTTLDRGDANDGDTSRPVPDPTVLTTQQMLRGVRAERDYVDAQLDVLRERLHGIDRATSLLNETVNRVPTDVTQQVTHLRELLEARFESVSQQFAERDVRSEREARDNTKAVDAAFAAQKEAAAKQNESNQSAIDKSEKSTAETLKTYAELFRSTTDSIKEKLSSLENQMINLHAVKQGGQEKISGVYALAGFILTLLVIGGIIAAFVAAKP